MKISVIIPVYNKIKYLRTILEQVRCQNFTDFECIIIDDGSFDGSEEVCDEFATIDSRFKVFHIQNGGVANARNLGLDNAKGEFITFIDADDEIHAEYLNNMYNKLLKSSADMFIGSICKFWDDKNYTEAINVPYVGLCSSEKVFCTFVENQYKNGIYGYCCGKLIKSSIAKRYKFDKNIRLAEDLDYYISMYSDIKHIYFDDNMFYRYRQDANNSSMQLPDNKIDYYTQLKIQSKIYDMINKVGYLTENNSYLIVNRMYDYVFFTLYHSSLGNIKNNIKKIRKLSLPYTVDIGDRSWNQKCILKPFLYKVDWLVVLLITLRFVIRKILKKDKE